MQCFSLIFTMKRNVSRSREGVERSQVKHLIRKHNILQKSSWSDSGSKPSNVQSTDISHKQIPFLHSFHLTSGPFPVGVCQLLNEIIITNLLNFQGIAGCLLFSEFVQIQKSWKTRGKKKKQKNVLRTVQVFIQHSSLGGCICCHLQSLVDNK